MKIILASKSERRKNLLKKIDLNFKIIDSKFDESKIEINHKNPGSYCKKLAFNKSTIVSQKFKNYLVIGADTIVYQKNQILGKPKNKNEAIKHLESLSGKEHIVYTGVYLSHFNKNIKKSFVEKTYVTFNKINNKEMNYYIDKYQPYDKSGSYGIQDWGSIFVQKINGCFYNVVGFPLPKFYKLLTQLNLK